MYFCTAILIDLVPDLNAKASIIMGLKRLLPRYPLIGTASLSLNYKKRKQTNISATPVIGAETAEMSIDFFYSFQTFMSEPF